MDPLTIHDIAAQRQRALRADAARVRLAGEARRARRRQAARQADHRTTRQERS